MDIKYDNEPPEVKNEKQYTKESEVFVFAELLKKIPQFHSGELPFKLQELVTKCQDLDSTQRLSIVDVYSQLMQMFVECNEEICQKVLLVMYN